MTDEVKAALQRRRSGDYSGIGSINQRSLQPRVDAELLADAYVAEHPEDDGEPVTEEWLLSVGFARHSLRMSMLLPPVWEEASIVEMSISPIGDDDWQVDLTQGVPDDLHREDDHVLITSKVFRTRGDARRLCKALGIELKEENHAVHHPG